MKNKNITTEKHRKETDRLKSKISEPKNQKTRPDQKDLNKNRIHFENLAKAEQKMNLFNSINFERVNVLLEAFNKATGFVTAILDLEGNILSRSGWRRICTEFHRINPETSEKCKISDTILAGELAKGEKYHCYKCLNGLVDVAVPIKINGEHIGNLFTGQFLFEKPDREFFRKQAAENEFEESSYLEALDEVPIVSEDQVKAVMYFLLNMTELISEMTQQKVEQISLNDALKESENRFKLAFENIPDVVVIYDKDLRIRYINEETRKLTDKPTSYFIGKRDDEIWPKEVYESYLPTLKDAFSTKKTCSIKTKLMLSSGVSRDLQITCVPIIDDDGDVREVMGITHDFTERKQAEKELHALAYRQGAILDAVPDLIMEVDNNKVYTWANKAGLKFFGEDVIGKNADFYFEGEQDTYRQVQPLFEGVEDLFYVESWQRRNDGEKRLLAWYCRVLKDNAGKVIGALSSAQDITELKHTEEEIKTIWDVSPDLLCVADYNTATFLKINPSFKKTLGYSEEELLGKPFLEFVHPDDLQSTINVIEEELKENMTVINFINRYLCKDGSYKYLNWVSKPIKAKGQTYAIARDVSEQIEAEKALAEQNIFLRNITETSPIGIVRTDAQGQLTYANQEAESILGLERSEIINRSYNDPKWEITDFDGKEFPSENLPFSLVKSKMKPVKDVRHAIRFPDGKTTLLSINASPELDENGKFNGMVATISDITEYKLADETIQKSEKLLNATGRMAKVGGWELNAKTNKVTWSEETYRIHEIDLDQEPPLDDAINFFHPEDRPILQEAIKNAFEKAEPYDLVLRFITATGKNLITHSVCQPVLEDGKVVKLFGTFQDITKLKQIEESLKESEERFNLAMKASKDGIFDWNLATNEIYYSPGWKSILGYEYDEIPNDFSIWETNTDPEDVKLSWQMQQELINKQRDRFEMEFKMKHKDGHWVDILSRAEAIFDKSGKAVRIVGTHVDITERKQAELALSRAAKEWQSTFDAAQDGIWILDLEHHILQSNREAEKIFNKSRKDLMKRFCYQSVHGTDEPIPECPFTRMKKTLKRESMELEIDGLWLEITVDPILDESGMLTGAVHIVRDITEGKKAQETLDYERRFSKNLINTAQAIILLLDTEGKIVSFNPYMENLTGYKLDEVKGKDWFTTFLPECDYDKIRKLFKTALNETSTKGNINPIMTKEGKKLSIEWYDKVLKNRDGNITNIVSVGYDITDRLKNDEELEQYRKRLEELVDMRTAELQAANKELEAFAYSVSHDLRAPLRAINGFTSILMEDYAQKLDEEGKRIGALIQNNSRQMGQLIDDLLAFSRLGRASMQASTIDMKNMVKAIYHEAASPAERKRIRFSIGPLPPIKGDPTMFRQVWMNLISNALKFTSKRKIATIDVSCKREKNRYIFSIKDNGAGFNMKYKDKLFGVFQRLHTEREFSGTGVGLALVQRIILRHKGLLWAEGEEDKGAVFYFSLPKKSLS